MHNVTGGDRPRLSVDHHEEVAEPIDPDRSTFDHAGAKLDSYLLPDRDRSQLELARQLSAPLRRGEEPSTALELQQERVE